MQQFEYIAEIFVLGGIASAIVIAVDTRSCRQPMRIMRSVWILTGLWAGFFGLWAYYAFGRPRRCTLEEKARTDRADAGGMHAAVRPPLHDGGGTELPDSQSDRMDVPHDTDGVRSTNEMLPGSDLHAPHAARNPETDMHGENGGHAMKSTDGARMSGMIGMERMEMHGTGMTGTDRAGMETRGVGMSGTEISGMELPGTGMQGMGEQTMQMSGMEMPGTGMTGTDKTGMETRGVGMSGTEMSGMELPGTGIQGMGEQTMQMSGMELPGMEMHGTGMTGTNGTGMEMQGMEMPARPRWQSVVLSTLHCGAGCTLADVLGEWFLFFVPVAIGGSLLAGSWVFDYILALIFGIGFQYAAIRAMEPATPRGAIVKRAAKADILSLTAWQAGMYGWMAVVIFALRDGTPPPRTTFSFWFMMQIAMAFGFLLSLPVNVLLIRSGIKHGM